MSKYVKDLGNDYEVLTEEDKEELELYEDSEFELILKNRERFMALDENSKQAVQRWANIEALQKHYADFRDFLYDYMTELMGFQCSDLQLDIAEFMFGKTAPKYLMVQAQRSQAKSTICAIGAVWCLIHDPKHRVLIVSAGSEVSTEISSMITQSIMNWDILKCMRPDRQHGDRASTKAFDVHWQLKGIEKSPSVACIGITSNMQGRRADLLIADDIESSKNGTTEEQRQKLEHLSRDFPSICQKGRILYLGTPQTADSIYKNMPERGYQVRVWTGRYPTEEQEKLYDGLLAPYLKQKMEENPSLRRGGGADGSQGQATDPVIVPEEKLQFTEADQGEAYFQLQHMLNTTLNDELRYPLKSRNAVVLSFGIDKAPGEIVWMPEEKNRVFTSGINCKPELYRPFQVSEQMYKYESKYLFVDTAGGGANADETVAVVCYGLHGYIFVAEVLAMEAKNLDENYEAIAKLAWKHKVNEIGIEKNHGWGAFAHAFRPVLAERFRELNEKAPVEEQWNVPRVEEPVAPSTMHKEKRITDSLIPVLGRHKLIIHRDVIDYDQESIKKYPVQVRQSYSLLHQMNKITIEKGALLHDDRLDSLAWCVTWFAESLELDEKVRMEQKHTDETIDFFAEWGGNVGGRQDSALGYAQDRFNRNRLNRHRKR